MNTTPLYAIYGKILKYLLYECNEVDSIYPIGRYIIFQQTRDKVLIVEMFNQVC